MGRDREEPASPMRASEESAAVEPMRIVMRDDGQGGQTLDVVEGTFEQTYRIGDTYSTKLFLELCRSRGLLPYRHKRQHAGTISVRCSLAEHNALWARFLELSRQLEAQLYEHTCAFVKASVPSRPEG